MLTLVTGQPGNGKTLYTLGLVEREREKTGRAVFQSGIPDLTLPWSPLDDPAGWHELGDGSMVVIDECQRVFPPRKQGAAVPPHVAQFETHRHRGFDVWLITQHPQLLDIAVRKLVGRHVHVVRKFGRETATVLQWERCVDPHDRSVQKEALRSKFDFPRERYAQYKSADLHTVKKDFPVKPVAMLAAAVLGVVGLSWFAGHRLMANGDRSRGQGAEVGQANNVERAIAGNRWDAEALKARVPTWPWSAAYYDEVAKVRSYPRITGCMELRIGDVRKCTCSDGQGVAQVSAAVCHDYMAGRYFDPTRPVEDVKAENIRRLDAATARPSSDQGGTGTTFRAPANSSQRPGGAA